MFYIRMADLNIAIDNKYSYVEKLCRGYTVPEPRQIDLIASASDEEIKNEIGISEFPCSPAYAEGVCIYRNICSVLPKQFGAYLFHTAVIEYEGRGYAFSAKSGTGKSTHVGIWQKRFGNAVRIINGDKPIMKFEGDTLYAYGTPWCGKEGQNENDRVPVSAICFLERGTENRIRKIGADEAVTYIFNQILTPDDLETVDTLFPLLDRTLRSVPCYVLYCNMDVEAAQVAYDGMNG